MLSKPGVDFYRALLVTTRQPHWKSIEEALNTELQTTYESMRDCKDVVYLHQLQGRAQALSDLLKVAANAQSILEKLTKGRM